MIQGSVLQSSEVEVGEAQLQSVQDELSVAIKQAKALALSCKVGHYEQTQFQTDLEGELVLPQYKEHINYNEQFWKKYLKNEINFAIIKELSDKVSRLESQLRNIEALDQEYQKLYKIKNRKKNRRLASQIQKNFQCPYEHCYRQYGSDVSLNLHIKLKHGGGNKSDREQLAEELCLAELRGLPMPEMRFNLPKGFLQEYKKKYAEKIQQHSGSDWMPLKNKSLLKLSNLEGSG